MESWVLKVDGMSCTGCGQRIEKALRQREGVHGAVADHVCGRVEIRVDPQLADRGAVAERIDAAGYHLAEVDTR